MAINYTGSREELEKYITVNDFGSLQLTYHPAHPVHRQGMILKKGSPQVTFAGVTYLVRSIKEVLGVEQAPPQRQYKNYVAPVPKQTTMELAKRLKSCNIYANESCFSIVTKDTVTVCYKSTRFEDLQIDFSDGLLEVYQTTKL